MVVEEDLGAGRARVDFHHSEPWRQDRVQLARGAVAHPDLARPRAEARQVHFDLHRTTRNLGNGDAEVAALGLALLGDLAPHLLLVHEHRGRGPRPVVHVGDNHQVDLAPRGLELELTRHPVAGREEHVILLVLVVHRRHHAHAVAAGGLARTRVPPGALAHAVDEHLGRGRLHRDSSVPKLGAEFLVEPRDVSAGTRAVPVQSFHGALEMRGPRTPGRQRQFGRCLLVLADAVQVDVGALQQDFTNSQPVWLLVTRVTCRWSVT